ncbi:MAG: M48 family metallopeptidase [Anaerolineales bacterium]|nr:M48 family metallopeptidase [Anaerolineales bacterium]
MLIPLHLDEDSAAVQQFIADALTDLPTLEYCTPPVCPEEIHQMVTDWAARLGVEVTRTQVRAMRNKWGSISTAGTLTLADDLLRLPGDLVEYVIVHELLHLKFPDHRKGWRVSMGMYISDWQDRERQLQTSFFP